MDRKRVLTVFVMNYLEVLDGGLGDSAIEVQHMRRCVFIPHRRLVAKLNHIFHSSILVPYQQAVTILCTIGKTKVSEHQQRAILPTGFVLLS